MAQRTDARSDSERPPSGPNGGPINGALHPEGKVNGDAKANGEAKQEVALAAPSPTPWRSYKEQIASIAQKIVEAQRPIRVLQALRWEPSVEEAFRRSRYRDLPRVGVDEY